MNSFVTSAKRINNQTQTENGANAYKSTGNALVDAFGVIGSLRNAETSRVERLFGQAFSEDALLATKMMFYARNIRGVGLGERKTFCTMLKYLAITRPEIVKKNILNIPYYGRWDDMYTLIGTPCEEIMWKTIKKQWKQDKSDYKEGKPVSIMAKWLKSANASSPETVKLGYKTARHLGLDIRKYRRWLSKFRTRIDVVEKKMSSNDWNSIDYEAVPSRAMAIYRNAFARHGATFEKYVTAVENGNAKINSTTLYPYDIFEKMGFTTGYREATFRNYDRVLEAQWKALPNYVEEGANFLVMADTSGSMYGRPMATSVSLATYFAERNHGPFKDLFMTFSSNPQFVELKGDTLYDKVKCIKSIVSSTNLEKAFDLVLKTAVNSTASQKDLPKALVVISDVEIDHFQHNSSCWDFLSVMRTKFASHGYEMPNIVMWNVESRHDCYLANSNFPGVQFASGSSASVFKSLIANMGKSAYQAVVDTLNDPIFDRVVI